MMNDGSCVFMDEVFVRVGVLLILFSLLDINYCLFDGFVILGSIVFMGYFYWWFLSDLIGGGFFGLILRSLLIIDFLFFFVIIFILRLSDGGCSYIII